MERRDEKMKMRRKNDHYMESRSVRTQVNILLN